MSGTIEVNGHGTAATLARARRTRTRTWRLLSVLGSRPEVIQAAPLAQAFRSRLDEILVDTGQHYDVAMASGQILDTGLPRPRHNLAVGSRPDQEQLSVGEERITSVIEAERRYTRRIELVPRKEYHLEQFDIVGK